MNREREMGMAVIAAMVLWVIICILALCSCGGRKVITETIVAHDTLIVAHYDTVSVDRWHVRHDTLRMETERVVTLLQPDKTVPAETVRIESNHWYREKAVVSDSTSKFVAKVDSILRALEREHNKDSKKAKGRIPWWWWLVVWASPAVGCIELLRRK